ncbi:MAG: MGMT family protein [Mogibacterium sp.]|nr:MGMT family protein [Mogibacterium sp.]
MICFGPRIAAHARPHAPQPADAADNTQGPGLARVVGNLLHVNPDPQRYPCYKVVNSQGRLTGRFAFGGINVQKERLENDGVEVSDDYIVDLSVYQWRE